MIITDLATYLTTQTDLVLGTSLYLSYQPESPDEVVAIYDTGGVEPDRYLPTADPTVQILVRAGDYQTAHDRAHELASILHGLTNQTIGDYYIYYIFLLGEPAHLGRDKRDRDEYTLNLHLKIRRNDNP